MRNLYDILGLSSNATDLQIEQAYRIRLHVLKDEQKLLSEPDNLELRAIEEAYSVLTSPARRERYDQKLKILSQPVSYQVVEARPAPWLKIMVVATVLALGSTYLYNNQQNKARIEQLRLEEAKAKVEAEKAEKLAEAEKIHAEQVRLSQERRDEENNRQLTERARYDGQRIHSQIEQMEASRQREVEREERQEKSAQLREEQLAKSRVQQQNAAMERALNRPIEGSSYRPSVTVIQSEPPRTAYSRYQR